VATTNTKKEEALPSDSNESETQGFEFEMNYMNAKKNPFVVCSLVATELGREETAGPGVEYSTARGLYTWGMCR